MESVCMFWLRGNHNRLPTDREKTSPVSSQGGVLLDTPPPLLLKREDKGSTGPRANKIYCK